ncbi:hypothetical protein [Streptomyces sp. R08]|uniref:Uncharacterized protein n=1 Tax=Streptomyces sp. R08 TaxID=3238624 RepID=A0AB39M8F0_9ACTN
MEQQAGRFVAQLAASSAELMTSSSGIILRDTAKGVRDDRHPVRADHLDRISRRT